MWFLLPLLILAADARNPDGTLGLIQRPASTHPALALSGDDLPIRLDAPPTVTAFEVDLVLPDTTVPDRPLEVIDTRWDPDAAQWALTAALPADLPADLYDLRVRTPSESDTSRIAVKVFGEWPTSYTVVHYTDTQNLFAVPGITEAMPSLVRDVSALQPTFAVVTGDLVTYGQPGEYVDFLDAFAEARVPTFHVPGNHDIFWIECGERAAYQERYERTIGDLEYAFTVGEHLWVGVELSGYRSLCPHADLSEEQVLWLEHTLSEHAAAPVKVLFGHQEEHSAGELEGIAVNHDVDAYLYGHIHRDEQEWVGDTTFTATGWAGDGLFRMVRVEGDAVDPLGYAGDPVSSVPGGDAITVETATDPDDPAVVTTTWTNTLDQAFPHVQRRFDVPTRDQVVWRSDRGAVWQTVPAGDRTYVYVRDIDVAAGGVTAVTVWPEPAPEDTGDTGLDDAGPGDTAVTGTPTCGCGTGPSPAPLAWLLLPLIALRRRC